MYSRRPKMSDIVEFKGKHRWLSNFSDAKVSYEGVEYPTVEHAYQASKTLVADERRDICAQPTPVLAKKRGRKVTMREDWDQVKIPIMEDLLSQKFSDPVLAKKLVETGDSQLVEGNWWGDVFWGVCRGEGQNNLGKILMKIRERHTRPCLPSHV
jgi:ribA/ribD-fused uncharacterized protein